METGEQKDSKKARVDPPPAPLVPHCMVSIDMAKLQCPVCTHPLKPPIFQCAAGHLACGACHGQLADKDRCYSCANPGGYSRNLPLEDVVRSTKVWCPNSPYGCNSPMMILHEMDDHQRKCPHAPCRCPEPGCAFVSSAAWFGYHLMVTHSWPVNSIGYGKACQLQLPESKPRCLLAAMEDGRLFVVSVAALRDSVSLVCLRANAAAGPHYTCKMWATGSAAAASGKVPTVSVEMEVPSSAVATGMEAKVAAALAVPRKMLHGPSKELHLNVRIDKVQT
ncbi:E3 ubiquitin-protein ligase SINA-like 10 [Sorghum bicolor]|uniref:E3 ubiquitin-protein ligase SINA-like 10 n=1 Tax=Sorghum bicolor TaxID=4558 RepID=UPI000B424403|nr:E3 ubiquitin-protein ligase SINA-like 10 [Sorghum bicolor]|eukprot:XP_021311768.1 E3 ubiquitin-protein ligase SINA-like 10 [Sorghum bicolor]